jgi:hypothetical protein
MSPRHHFICKGKFCSREENPGRTEQICPTVSQHDPTFSFNSADQITTTLNKQVSGLMLEKLSSLITATDQAVKLSKSTIDN